MKKTFATAALFFSLTTSALTAGSLSVTNHYVRSMPPVIKNTTAYLQLNNSGAEMRTLVAAESPVARLVELHTHIREDDMLKMRRVDHIDIPPGETVEMKPGGRHVMLIGLKKDLNKVDEIKLTLVFKNGERVEIKAPVRSARSLN